VVWSCVGVCVLAFALAHFSPVHDVLFPDKEAPPQPFVISDSHIAPIEWYLESKEERERKGGVMYEYEVGRWLAPIHHPQFHDLNWFQTLIQKKEWEFVALSTGRFFIGVAVGQLNYAGTGFVYVYDTHTTQTHITSSLLPLGFRTQVSKSSIEGCSSFSLFSLDIKLCKERILSQHHTPNTIHNHTFLNHITISASFPDSTTLLLNATLGTQTTPPGTLALSYPMGPKRAAYTHKSSGVAVSSGHAILTTSNGTKTTIPLDNAVGLLDWTRSMHARLTQWFWVAISWVTASGDRLGINLSHGVYPLPTQGKGQSAGSGESGSGSGSESGGMKKEIGLENGIWLNDVVYPVHSPLIVQGTPGHGHVQIGSNWRCYTEDGSIDLMFHAVDLVPSVVKLYFLDAELLHHFGVYSGRVVVNGRVFEVENVPGILEDHFAWW